MAATVRKRPGLNILRKACMNTFFPCRLSRSGVRPQQHNRHNPAAEVGRNGCSISEN